MRGKEWTEEENYICLCTDLTVRQKAELLDRTEDSIRDHLRRLHKYGNDYKQFENSNQRERNSRTGSYDVRRDATFRMMHYSNEDDSLILTSKLPDDEIGKMLGRSEAAIRTRRYALKKEGK